MLEGKPGARPILSYWTGSGIRTIYELPPLTLEQKLAAAAHWRNLAQDSIASGEHEVSIGISTGQTHQHNAALYIEIAEKIEADANQEKS